jgi:hypothetical protein
MKSFQIFFDNSYVMLEKEENMLSLSWVYYMEQNKSTKYISRMH